MVKIHLFDDFKPGKIYKFAGSAKSGKTTLLNYLASEFLQNGSQVFWLDINYQFNILRLAATLNRAIGGANFDPPSLQLDSSSSLRSQLKSQVGSFDQSLPQTQINDNLRRIKITRCDTFASVELTLQSFVWRMIEGQIKTENKEATELVLIIDSISGLIGRENPKQDVLDYISDEMVKLKGKGLTILFSENSDGQESPKWTNSRKLSCESTCFTLRINHNDDSSQINVENENEKCSKFILKNSTLLPFVKI